MFVLHLAVIYNVYLFQSIVGQMIPSSPCPNVFHYELNQFPQHNDMALKGVITVVSTIPILLKVHMQIPALLTSKYPGRLELDEEKQGLIEKIDSGVLRKIRFNLFYAANLPLPEITLIQLNNQILCSSRPIPRRVITDLTLEYSVKRVITNNSPPSSANGNNRYEWNYQDFFVKNRRPPQQSQSLQNNYEKYRQNPFIKFPIPENNVPTAYDAPNNEKKDNVPDVTVVDISDTPYGHNIYFDNIVNALKSDSVKPFQPLQDHRYNPSPIPTPAQDLTQLSDTCGKSFQTNLLIVNGSAAKRGEWPWLVALFKRVELGVLFVCGSTLISNQYLLTAAHCVKDHTDTANKGLLAYVGRYSLKDWGEPGTEPREISDIYIHPDYRSEPIYSDIALLKLQYSVTISPYVNPACIWAEEEDPNLIVGSDGIVVGWGMDGKGRKVTETPNMVKLPIVSKETCLDSKIDFKFFASNKTFCAGSRNGSGPCNGDSGGGFLMPRTDKNGNVRWYIRGIISLSLPKRDRGEYECDLSQYLIFTDVAKFRSWLSKYISAVF